MFRRLESSLPPDASYPADLRKLGYFINAVGQIRMMDYPDKEYFFHYSNQDRHNEVYREAMQACSRQEVLKRLSALGIKELYLPTLTTTKPDHQPHVPILAPPPQVLKTRKRVIVVINDSLNQDLGILAYRQLQRELGLNAGSVVDFAKELTQRSNHAAESLDIFRDGAEIENQARDTPGLIVTNTGQLLYSHQFDRAMTVRSWSAMARKSIYHDPVRIHDIENKVQGNRSPTEHIKFVFDHVIQNPDFVSPDAELYVITIEDGAENFLQILEHELEKYGDRIAAMAIIMSRMQGCQIQNPKLKSLLHKRCREWKISLSDDRAVVEVPIDYAANAPQGNETSEPVERAGSINPLDWCERVARPTSTCTITSPLSGITVSTTSSEPASPLASHKAEIKGPDGENKKKRADTFAENEWEQLHGENQHPKPDPICPTFPGGGAFQAECIFTNRAIQQAILQFFEEVAQDPWGYRNPNFDTGSSAPAEANSQSSDVGYEVDDNFLPLLPAEAPPEKARIEDLKNALQAMQQALVATVKDTTIPELAKGRQMLEKRILKKEIELDGLEKKTSTVEEEAVLQAQGSNEKRREWEPAKKAPAMSFAGTMVDREIARGAGLTD